MMAIEYSEAVQFVKGKFQCYWNDELEFESFYEFQNATRGAAMLCNNTATLLASAEVDAGSFDRLRLGIAHLLEQGEELPPEALTWLVRHLRGEVTRPKAGSGAKTQVFLHTQICTAVLTLVHEYGMKATRNDSSEATSACDAVADALAELGLKPTTFHGVKRIWLYYERI
jgi:hypothetical protein